MTFVLTSQFHVYLPWVNALLASCLKGALFGAFSVIIVKTNGSFAALLKIDAELTGDPHLPPPRPQLLADLVVCQEAPGPGELPRLAPPEHRGPQPRVRGVRQREALPVQRQPRHQLRPRRAQLRPVVQAVVGAQLGVLATNQQSAPGHVTSCGPMGAHLAVERRHVARDPVPVAVVVVGHHVDQVQVAAARGECTRVPCSTVQYSTVQYSTVT